MKCVIPGANIRILARAIHALAKIGDEMYVHPKEDALSFRTVNLANSAYADFTFFEEYFSYYIYEDLPEEEAQKCKIPMRSALAVFKMPHYLDKQVETCHIILESNASEILFILKYKNSVTKKHLLPILDSDKLQANYNTNNTVNEVQSQPRVFSDAIQNFQNNVVEITLEVSPQKMLLRNYLDDVSGMSNITRTQLALSVGEFERYVISTGTTITFCMKELRAILTFAELANVPISIHFESAGKPVIFVMKSQTFEVNIVLSTLNHDSDTQTDTTLSSKVEKHTKTKTNKRTSKKSNKLLNRGEKRSAKINNTLLNSKRKNVHPALMDSVNNADCTISNGSISGSTNELMQNNVEEIHHNHQDITIISQNYENRPSISNYSSNSHTRLNNKKELVNSIFSTVTKRKSKDKHQSKQCEETESDQIPNSPPTTPPAKKARVIFQKCFQTTFNPQMLPGHDIILAEDSDEYCSD